MTELWNSLVESYHDARWSYNHGAIYSAYAAVYWELTNRWPWQK